MKPPKGTPIVSELAVKAIGRSRYEKPGLFRSRLLLGHAVQRAESEDEIAAGNANHFAIWKQAGERIQGHAIVRIIERWDEYDLIGDVEICVACGKALPVEIDGRRHRESFHAQHPSVLIFHG